MTSKGHKNNKGSHEEARTLSHQLPYPVFGVEWVRHRTLIVAGGGGSSRTGVSNAVTVYKVVLCVRSFHSCFPTFILALSRRRPTKCLPARHATPPKPYTIPIIKQTHKQLKDGSIAALAPHRERATGEDLPYFLTALPAVGVLAVALGRRLEVRIGVVCRWLVVGMVRLLWFLIVFVFVLGRRRRFMCLNDDRRPHPLH